MFCQFPDGIAKQNSQFLIHFNWIARQCKFISIGQKHTVDVAIDFGLWLLYEKIYFLQIVVKMAVAAAFNSISLPLGERWRRK